MHDAPPSRSDMPSLEPSSRLAATAFYLAVGSAGVIFTSAFSLVMWAVGCVLALVALVLGGVSYFRLEATFDFVGQKRSKAAMIVSGLVLGLTVALVLLFLRGLSQTSPSSWH
ncbi:hypothetical protein Q664_43935 [Archangium violaceum Cb vi76]|uniref:Uncharacterized protein n=2 Tax=Archangium violaceum TaxID=83451 RepID=A0A084SHT2_9BACT|nr:hypothetical protein Q664_43935 [Archangium violaceum Cb vi76]